MHDILRMSIVFFIDNYFTLVQPTEQTHVYDTTVKPVYNGRVYSSHPVHNGYLAISQG